jgi:hypothetical protein
MLLGRDSPLVYLCQARDKTQCHVVGWKTQLKEYNIHINHLNKEAMP